MVIVVVVGILSYMDKNLGKHNTNHGVEATKVVPTNGYEHAILKV